MTRYDPFAYGEVSLDPNSKGGGPPPDADDLLFDPGEATKQAPPADTNWSMLSESDDAELTAAPDSSAAMAFGSDILGEEPEVDSLYGEPAPEPVADDEFGTAPEGMAPLSDLMNADGAGELDACTMVTDPFVGQELIDCEVPDGSTMDEAVAPQPAVVPAAPGKARAVRRRPLPPPSVKPRAAARKQKRATPRRRHRPALAALVPLMLCASGGTGASWFLVMQHNPVMAGILGAATLISALFSWLLLRG